MERSGETWRPQDKHINGEELIERYGIRAGEFGNWTNTLERQASLDQAYDAFADLAFALDIDEKKCIPARTILWKPRDCFWSKRTWRCSSTL